MHRVTALIVCLLFFTVDAISQVPNYPKGYFRWPLNLKPAIVANLGELRNNHWHMGLDIRTDQKVNQQVFAAASGYIAKVRVEPFGFGRVIFINHPNGLTTAYGHLNEFFPALETFVRQQQYAQETWPIELEFSPTQFPVAKGAFIALSGSTGGSQGPHVHFEIRDTKTQKCLNPLLFGMPLEDNVPPVFVKLGMFDRSYSVYEQTPAFFALKKAPGGYIISQKPLLKTGLRKVSFAIQAYDRINGSMNQDGIYAAALFFDEQPLIAFRIDSIGYDQTRYMNAHIDYRLKYNGGSYLQYLSRLPGDLGPEYTIQNSDGVIELNDTLVHAIRIEILDAYQNKSELRFQLQWDESMSRPSSHAHDHDHFSPGVVNIFEKSEFEIYLPEDCLYDTIPVVYYPISKRGNGSFSVEHAFDNPSIPVHTPFTVRIKPNEPVPTKWIDKMIIMRQYGDKRTVRKASLENGFLVAEFNEFGRFQAFLDLEPPTINEPGRGDTILLNALGRIVFRPDDNFAVESFRAELDGQWLRFTNDKGSAYIYNFDEHCPDGVHQLKVTVEDIAGNSTTKTWWFKKLPFKLPPLQKRGIKAHAKKKTIIKKKKGSPGKR